LCADDHLAGRWHTDIQWEYRIAPPLLRPELLAIPGLGSFRPFRGLQGTIVPLPAKVAARLSGVASPRLVSLGVREGLADSGQVRVDAAIERHDAAVRQELGTLSKRLSRWRSNCSWCGWLTELGFEVKHAGRTNDG